jgi:phosphoribosylformimino-5-aminoimidazole carboxamide ribotide isomerase
VSVVIIDYGSGNLHSAAKAFERAAREAELDEAIAVSSDPDAVLKADRIVLPGVGAFADCRRGLDSVPGMVEALQRRVRREGCPFFGICVGMQLMATRGLEHTTSHGLDWIPGDVKAIEPDDRSLKIPHMGWNTLAAAKPHPVLEGIPTGPEGLHAYFVHSYALDALDRHRRARQPRRRPVPSRKEPGPRPQAHRQLPEVAPVILYPAIDLKEGRCVRLVQGDMDQATVFNDDPADQAATFERQGFEWLHVVDLDGAFAGKPMNAAAVEAILNRVKIPVQLGGGIRDMKTVEGWLRKGVSRVIIGTAAVRDPAFVREAARLHPGKIAVGIDAKDGRVAVDGWAQTSTLTAEELGRRFEDAGVAAIIYTDIARDGILKGLNIPMTLALARAVSIPVIASGGLASMADIERLTQPECAVLGGAISGRALYDGRIDPDQALALLRAVRKENA